MANNPRDTSSELRQTFDSNDPFMGAHQILKTRRIEREVPGWAKDKKKVQQLLLKSFPKLATDVKQRLRAARWARVIQLYLVLGMTYGEVAGELELRKRNVEFIIRAIYRVSRGLRADGRGFLGAKKVGRPRKTKSMP